MLDYVSFRVDIGYEDLLILVSVDQQAALKWVQKNVLILRCNIYFRT